MKDDERWWVVLDAGVTVGIVTESPESATEREGAKFVQGWRVDLPTREFVRVVRAEEGDES